MTRSWRARSGRTRKQLRMRMDSGCPVKNRRAVTRLIKTTGLDRGESEALVPAREIKADRIFLDDLAARRVALRRHMPIIGTLGLLLLAKKLHLISTVKPLVAELIAAGRYI